MKYAGQHTGCSPFERVNCQTLCWQRCSSWLAPLLLGIAQLSAVDQAGGPQSNGLDPNGLRQLSLTELMNVEVTTVSGHAEPLTEAPSAIQVVTSDDILRSGATSLPEALREASNLEIAQLNATNWAISARGFDSSTSDKMLVMIDGRSVYTPLYAGVFWNMQQVFLPDVQQIEVISGPGATLWGSNAVNGVISIESKNSKDTQGLYVEGASGTQLRDEGGVRYGGALSDQFHYRVYEMIDQRAQTDLAGGGDGGDNAFTDQGGFRMDWDASPIDLLTLQGDVYDGLEHTLQLDERLGGDNILSRWTHRFSDKSSLQILAYDDRTHIDDLGSLAEDLDTYDVELQHRFPLLAWNDITWGIGYRLYRDDVRNIPSEAFLPAKLNIPLYSAFAQDEIALFRALHLTLGSKFEHNYWSGFDAQPSARLSYEIDQHQNTWAAVSRALRTPSRIDTDLAVPGAAPYLLSGNPDFDPERETSFELGYRAKPERGIELSVSTYYSRYSQVRSYEEANATTIFPITTGNDERGHSYGGELSAKATLLEGVRLKIGYTETRVRLSSTQANVIDSNGSTESDDPQHMASAHLYLDLPYRIDLDLMPRYVSPITVQGVPSYTELNVRLGWEASATWTFAVVGENLLHHDHVEFAEGSTPNRIPRSVYGKIVWTP